MPTTTSSAPVIEAVHQLHALRTEMAELRALLRLSLTRRRPKRTAKGPTSDAPVPSERRAQIRATVLRKLGARR